MRWKEFTKDDKEREIRVKEFTKDDKRGRRKSARVFTSSLSCSSDPYSVHLVLVAVYRVRPAASVRLCPSEPDQRCSGHLHPIPGTPQLSCQPHHLLPLLYTHLSQPQVTYISPASLPYQFTNYIF